jgi:phosphoribosylformylglycinamidine (FGAM) synthase-like enzyme
MCVAGGRGATVDLRNLPRDEMRDDELLFSESNSRFLLATNNPENVLNALRSRNIPAATLGTVGGDSLDIILPHGRLQADLNAVQAAYATSLERILEPWQK